MSDWPGAHMCRCALSPRVHKFLAVIASVRIRFVAGRHGQRFRRQTVADVSWERLDEVT
jgi:hypothetical protein